MAAKPTFGTRENIPGRRIQGQRNLEVVTLYNSGDGVTAAFNQNIFRAPPGGAKITYIGVGNSAATMYHAAAEADTWKFVVANVSTAGNMSLNNPSLSNQTLAATSFKNIPINKGNATLNPGAVLQIQLTTSGAAQTMARPMVVIEWQALSGL
jgi:hypothetical protein